MRYAKTHRVFDELLAAGSKKSLPGLLADTRLTFTHFLNAANHCVLPVEALLEARDNGLSANSMLRYAVRRANRGARKQQRVLGGTADVANDDDNPESTAHVPTRDEVRTKLERRIVRLELTAEHHRRFDSQVKALAAAYGTQAGAGGASDCDEAARWPIGVHAARGPHV